MMSRTFAEGAVARVAREVRAALKTRTEAFNALGFELQGGVWVSRSGAPVAGLELEAITARALGRGAPSKKPRAYHPTPSELKTKRRGCSTTRLAAMVRRARLNAEMERERKAAAKENRKTAKESEL